MDRISFSNINGQACGNTGTLVAAYPSVGPGNLGMIRSTAGMWLPAGLQRRRSVQLQYQLEYPSSYPCTLAASQSLGQLAYCRPECWQYSHAEPARLGSLHRGSRVKRGSEPFRRAVNQVSASGINWRDLPSHAQTYFATGTSVDTAVFTLSNYAGPDRILAPTYAPGITNGDAFSNTFPTIYVSTVFGEASAGTALAGTTPAMPRLHRHMDGCFWRTFEWSMGLRRYRVFDSEHGRDLWSLRVRRVSKTCPVYINSGGYQLHRRCLPVHDWRFQLCPALD